MKSKKKALLLLLCAALLVVASVLGTLAYLTSTDNVENTFTIGQVHLNLDEADVNEEGSYVNGHDTRVKANSYRLIPGHTYQKDPTVTVLKGSAESYVRMKVTFSFSKELDAIFAAHNGADLMSIFTGYDSTNWSLCDVTKDDTANTRTYEFRYVGSANAGTKTGTVAAAKAGNIVLDDLFEQLVIPNWITNEQLATLVTTNVNGEITGQMTITIVAEAIQADGFSTATDAWAAFDTAN